MEKYKRLNKIEFLFFGLAVGYYFGSESSGRETMIYIFVCCVILAIAGYALDRRDLMSIDSKKSVD
jgi:hypothetical protein